MYNNQKICHGFNETFYRGEGYESSFGGVVYKNPMAIAFWNEGKEEMELANFKVICCKCGSDKILEKSSNGTLQKVDDPSIQGEGIQRKCMECDNEELFAVRTWVE